MKQLKFNVLSLLLLFFAGAVLANDNPVLTKEFKKQIKKEFSLAQNGLVSVTNKYGDIRINSGAANEVSIEVEITVNASSQSNADKIFERINIEFSNSTNLVKAMTNIESKKGIWGWNSKGKGDFKIDYFVQMPKNAKLELSHKYGDIYGDDRGNDVDVNLKYGNVNMGIIDGNLNVSCGYGKASFVSSDDLDAHINYSSLKINTIKNAKCVSKYSNITIEEANDLDIDSKYDKYTLGMAEKLNNVGKYDEFKIESIRSLDVNTKYTHLSADHLLDMAYLKFKYGSIKIQHIAPGFSTIDLDSDYVGVKLGFDAKASFTFDIESDYAPVKLPKNYEYKNRAKYDYNFEGDGYVGSQSSNSKLKAKLNYGSLTITENRSE